MCETAGVRLRKLDELIHGKSLFMDFTNQFLRERGYEVPVRLPGEAAEILASLSQGYDLCLYEYFLTDIVGHRGNYEKAVDLLRALDYFLWKVVQEVDLTSTSVMITSDHGNIEDMTSSQHTANPVPTLLWGNLQEVFSDHLDGLSLDQITPLLTKFFLSS
jgi:bisphosphoglycerate-independent phosphoglycerate mutase (AlkP superfamily)